MERNREEIVLNELEASLNPQELEEVEVVKPETLARWRTFVPEETIAKILRQRIWVAEMRRAEELVTLPNIAYSVPRLPEIDKTGGYARSTGKRENRKDRQNNLQMGI